MVFVLTSYIIMSSQIFYIVIDKDDHEFLGKHGYIPFYCNDNMDNWMLMQMKKRMPAELFYNQPSNKVGPHWLYLNTESIYWDWVKNENKVVLEIVKNVNNCLFFDDSDWVQVANNVMNNKCYTYLAHSQKEADANENATAEKIRESWERIFASDSNLIDTLRDEEYCGPIELRAITPYVSSADVRKIILTS